MAKIVKLTKKKKKRLINDLWAQGKKSLKKELKNIFKVKLN
jgi:hypothetical protein